MKQMKFIVVLVLSLFCSWIVFAKNVNNNQPGFFMPSGTIKLSSDAERIKNVPKIQYKHGINFSKKAVNMPSTQNTVNNNSKKALNNNYAKELLNRTKNIANNGNSTVVNNLNSKNQQTETTASNNIIEQNTAAPQTESNTTNKNQSSEIQQIEKENVSANENNINLENNTIESNNTTTKAEIHNKPQNKYDIILDEYLQERSKIVKNVFTVNNRLNEVIKDFNGKLQEAKD